MVAALVGSTVAALTVGSAVAAGASGVTRQVISAGTGTIRGGALGDGALSWPEFAFGPQGPGEPDGGLDSAAKLVNRSLSQGKRAVARPPAPPQVASRAGQQLQRAEPS